MSDKTVEDFEPLELHDAAVQAFRDRLVKLQKDPKWPMAHWYNDKNFMQAFRTCLDLKANLTKLTAELAGAEYQLAKRTAGLRQANEELTAVHTQEMELRADRNMDRGEIEQLRAEIKERRGRQHAAAVREGETQRKAE